MRLTPATKLEPKSRQHWLAVGALTHPARLPATVSPTPDLSGIPVTSLGVTARSPGLARTRGAFFNRTRWPMSDLSQELRIKVSEEMHRKVHAIAMAGGEEAASWIRHVLAAAIDSEICKRTLLARLLRGDVGAGE